MHNLSALKKIKEYKLACEANIVSCFWKDPELLYSNEKLELQDFSHNTWKVYFTIAEQIVLKEKKPSLDDVTVGLYLEKHPKLKDKYYEYGGYETIDKSKQYVKTENLEGYVSELNKWNMVIKLDKNKFPIEDRIADYADMDTQEIYDELEALMNHLFVNVDSKLQSYNLCDGLHPLLDKMNEGAGVGLPLWNSPTLNKEIGGNNLGHITLFGGLSNVGKTSTTIELVLPSILDKDEKILIMVNEEDEEKWQRELIVWVCNNVLNKDLQKYVLRDGNFKEEDFAILKEAADWLQSKKDSKNLTLIPFEKYSTSLAIKVMKKYSSLGVKYFILDTFKNDSDHRGDNFWLNMQQNMVDIYDTVKPKVKNLHIWITFQLGKQSARQRYFTQDNIGLARNIVDPVSTCIMVRKIHEDEKDGGKNPLAVYRLAGKNNRTKIPVKLEQDKTYMAVFIVKNRFGSANEYQIVAENDLGINVYKEVGITHVPMDTGY